MSTLAIAQSEVFEFYNLNSIVTSNNIAYHDLFPHAHVHVPGTQGLDHAFLKYLQSVLN